MLDLQVWNQLQVVLIMQFFEERPQFKLPFLGFFLSLPFWIFFYFFYFWVHYTVEIIFLYYIYRGIRIHLKRIMCKRKVMR